MRSFNPCRMETPQEETPRKRNKAGIIIALLSIVVIVEGIKIYLDFADKIEIREQKANVEEELATTMQRLTEIKDELNQKMTEIQKLGGDISELQKAKAEVDAQLKRNTTRSAKEIKQLRDKVEGYEELLKIKDDEIDKLKSVNKELFSENKTLKTKQNKLGDSINSLTKNKNELASKVALASQLKLENPKVMAVNSKGKERESPFKNRQLEKLKVEFNLAENKVAPIEGKKIIIRVIDENGQVIFDVARGSGTFILNGKEEFYTASQEILFDNTRQKLSYLYEKGSDYPSGDYSVEVYTDGYLMGKLAFTVK
jgi:DNA repair exonuclease SbcCD ATPase subunit